MFGGWKSEQFGFEAGEPGGGRREHDETRLEFRRVDRYPRDVVELGSDSDRRQTFALEFRDQRRSCARVFYEDRCRLESACMGDGSRIEARLLGSVAASGALARQLLGEP